MELSPVSREEITDLIRKPDAADEPDEGEAATAAATDAASEEAPGEPLAQPRRAKTLEMGLDDHAVASVSEPTSPVSLRGKKKKKKTGGEEETTTSFQVDRHGLETLESLDPAAVSEAPEVPAPRRRTKSALEVPVTSLLAASAVWVFGLVAFFFVGRLSGFKSAGDTPQARDGLSEGFLTWQPPLELAVGAQPKSEPKPCWVTRQPSRWVASASKSVPFDMRSDGEVMLLGIAKDDKDALGLKVDPKTGRVEQIFEKKVEEKITRVSPSGDGGFFVSEKGSRVLAPASKTSPRFLVYDKTSIGAVDAPEDKPTELWPLEGDDEVTADAFLATAPDDFFLVFRRSGVVNGGYFASDKTTRGALGAIIGSGGKSGKPKSGFNGSEVAVVFADHPEGDEAKWQIRMGRAPAGQVPTSTEVVEVPLGGPGGDVIAPDIIGLKDGRWLLMWTEGTSGERAIRAQTYDSKMTPIGDPIALSPPAGNFGQAVLGVVGTYTTVAFLQAADGDYELWGAVLQCGS